MRRTEAELEAETIEALRAAFAEVGLKVELEAVESAGRYQPDAILEVDGTEIAVEVKSVVTENDATRLAELGRRMKLPLLVASDRLSEQARLALRREGVGYFDRRGQLRLVLPSVFVDAAVTGSARYGAAAGPLDGAVAKEVAFALLASPSVQLGVREIARLIDRAPSAVLEALERLRGAGLVTSVNEPLIPDLFWELAGVWRRTPVLLAAEPHPGEAATTDQLLLGLGEPHPDGDWQLDPEGWALTDTRAALAWGMPLVVSSNYPPDFYVPGPGSLRRAEAMLGRASDAESRACTVAIAPARSVCRHRTSLDGESWPVASHVVVALDLVQDRARGREVLERWTPPEGIVRVW